MAPCSPDEANGKTTEEFLDKVLTCLLYNTRYSEMTNITQASYNPLYYDGYHEFDDFRNEYEKKFGKPVYVGPYMRWK